MLDAMQDRLDITFRGMDPSPALEDTIRECAGKLAPLGHDVTRCEVVIEEPHRHHRQGRHFHVRVALSSPTGEIVVSQDPGRHDSHDDAHVAVRDAFDVARRRLVEQHDASRRRASVRDVAIDS
jgi:hypothetical protein